MIRKTTAFYLGALILAAFPAYGDFKYTESSKMTGGAMAGMVKFMGAVSKQARQSMQPTVSTTYVKGNLMRRDRAEGRSEIVDLDQRRIIFIDNQKRTYSITTFDQMKAALAHARDTARSQNASQPQSQQQANVQVTPKVDVTKTGKTATILNLPASEVQMRIDMEVQSTDPSSQGQSASMWVKSNSWITPNIPGYEELTAFYQKMGKEMEWVPGAVMGGNPQMSQGMAQLRQNAAALKGFPLLQYVSMGMAATGQPPAQGGQAQQAQTAPTQSQSSTQVTSPSDAIAKGIGGMLGGFGRKKKQQQDQSAQGTSTGAEASGLPPAPPAAPGSLMDMTVQVTAYSSDALEEDLFSIPAGYTQVQSDVAAEFDRPTSH
jgi:hypothetical protein